MPSRRFSRLGIYLLAIVTIVWCLAPFAWQIITSIKTDAEIAPKADAVTGEVRTVYIPTEPTTEHYRTLFTRKPFGRYLLNSAIVSAGSTVLCLFISALAAYAVARLNVRGGRCCSSGWCWCRCSRRSFSSSRSMSWCARRTPPTIPSH